jgi:hypothetical protein
MILMLDILVHQEVIEDDCDKENSVEYMLEEDASLLEAIIGCAVTETHDAEEVAQDKKEEGTESLDDRLAKFRCSGHLNTHKEPEFKTGSCS